MEQELRAKGYPVVAVASLKDVQPVNGSSGNASTLKLRELERIAIEEALRVNQGNRTHAARQLGISLRKLQYRLKEYNSAGQNQPG
jgi:DNA-binding NtrC family response regulator